MKKQRITHIIYTYRTGPAVDVATKGTRYYFSVRPVNNLDNAVEHDSYSTRGGRNSRVKDLKNSPKYKGKVQVKQENPNKKRSKK